MERTIKNIVNLGGVIYVHFSDPMCCAKFLNMAEEEGITSRTLNKPTEMHLADWLRVYTNGTLGYVQTNGRMLIMSGLKKASGETVHRIDFEKYINGDENYTWRYIYHVATE